ncbi:TolC family protein [Candidatus Endoriftia persephone]|jgi:cobalt-zinc-cadmium efflux system outer membrane protein|nr:TolC family protein [Candidatus Endoriftia persephone]EGV50982.1 efflux family outer membrane protein [endosymbiont of Riftia pachyptila (vent Ph05)]USF88717.1 TolC family protein [Candidatus Endoriftia persephone]
MSFSICTPAGLFACLLTLTAWTPAALSKGQSPHDMEVQQLAAIINRALESNPEIEAAQAAVDAAQARLVGAGLPLNNPELELEAERTDISTYTLGISQTIDWYDKQDALKQAMQAELNAARARVAALRLTKSAELLNALGRISTHHEITTLSKRRTGILERFARLAEQRHASGDIPQAEMELARLSLAEAVMQHAGNGAELIQARSDFFSLSGQIPGSGVKFPDRLPAALPHTSDDEALARNHPQVQAAQQMAGAARQQIHAADQARKADPTFGLRAGREASENLVALTFSIPLQIRNDFRSTVDAAQAEALQAEQEAHQAYRNLLARLMSARKRYKLVADAWSLWVSLGQTSLQQRIDLLETQWQAGEMSTTDYLLQVQQTLDTQIAGVRLHGDLWDAWVEWLNASGTLSPWLNKTSKEQ